MGRDRLVARRLELGLTQEQLAYTLGLDPRTVRRWEAGETTPQPFHRRPLAEALQLSPAELTAFFSGRQRSPDATILTIAADWSDSRADELCNAIEAGDVDLDTPGTAARLVHEWLVVEPPQTLELNAGRRVGKALADRATHRLERLRRLDDHLAGADLEAAVTRELAATMTLVREGSYGEEVGRRLLVTLADLCHLAGRTAADTGQADRAAHYFATGTAAAHAAGDRPLAGQLVSTLAYQVTNTGKPQDAVLIARSAVAGTASTATATTKALFGDRLAWAHANANDRAGTERALGDAEEAYADSRPGLDPSWTYWLNKEELDIMAGRCFVALGMPEQARERLERALDGYDESRPREAALYWSWLAEAQVQHGDVDEAATLASRVLELTSHTASTRSSDRVQHLVGLLRPHAGRASVDALVEQYRATA